MPRSEVVGVYPKDGHAPTGASAGASHRQPACAEGFDKGRVTSSFFGPDLHPTAEYGPFV